MPCEFSGATVTSDSSCSANTESIADLIDGLDASLETDVWEQVQAPDHGWTPNHNREFQIAEGDENPLAPAVFTIRGVPITPVMETPNSNWYWKWSDSPDHEWFHQSDILKPQVSI